MSTARSNSVSTSEDDDETFSFLISSTTQSSTTENDHAFVIEFSEGTEADVTSVTEGGEGSGLQSSVDRRIALQNTMDASMATTTYNITTTGSTTSSAMTTTLTSTTYIEDSAVFTITAAETTTAGTLARMNVVFT